MLQAAAQNNHVSLGLLKTEPKTRLIHSTLWRTQSQGAEVKDREVREGEQGGSASQCKDALSWLQPGTTGYSVPQAQPESL